MPLHDFGLFTEKEKHQFKLPGVYFQRGDLDFLNNLSQTLVSSKFVRKWGCIFLMCY